MVNDDWIAIPRELLEAIVLSEALWNADVKVKRAGEREYVSAQLMLESIAIADRMTQSAKTNLRRFRARHFIPEPIRRAYLDEPLSPITAMKCREYMKPGVKVAIKWNEARG